MPTNRPPVHPPPALDAILPWLRRWADLLDSRFRIPGTTIRFGIDPLLSLIPGLGDMATPLFTVVLFAQAIGLGIPRVILVRMALNALVDALLGAIPVAGNVGDIFWRANVANLALIERYARPRRPPTTSDYLFVLGVLAAFLLLLIIPVAAGLWLVLWIVG
jgi:hypothetical protein